VENEERAEQERDPTAVILDTDIVFSQCRNNRIKRLEESLNNGFPVDKEDDKGNTLLLVASQNCNQKICEMLLRRHANINHQNVNGNTALHFAMAYDQKVGALLIKARTMMMIADDGDDGDDGDDDDDGDR